MQGTKLDMIANNIANLNTVGFKKDFLTFSERMPEAIENGRGSIKFLNLLVHRYGGAPFIHSTSYSKTPGPLEVTDRPLDISIVGDGFFGVKDPATGKVFFTRAGNILIDPAGRLLTQDGRYQYITPGGDPIAIMPEGSPAIRIDKKGNLYQGDEHIATIGVFDFTDYTKLQKVGDTLFEDKNGGQFPATGYTIASGTLEKSNAQAVKELTELIKTLRLLEANLQMIRFQDATLERVINDVPRPR
jgi:flagellar basal-body rod protein FlgG